MDKKKWLGGGLLAAGAVAAAGWAASYPLTTRIYALRSPKLHQEVRLCVVSDLHGIVYGPGQSRLLEKIQALKPDGLLLPGDIVDNKVSWQGSWELLRAVGRRYPCWYSAGNHEFRLENVEQVKDLICSCGVTVLEGDAVSVVLNGQGLCLAGYDCSQDEPYENDWQAQRERCFAQRNDKLYSILLCHRPDYVADFRRSGYDLVVSGHAHGGQWRLPGVLNGLYAPGQGLFPPYAGGLYDLGGTKLVVSRGLRRDWLPRIFNPPELVLLRLLPEE